MNVKKIVGLFMLAVILLSACGNKGISSIELPPGVEHVEYNVFPDWSVDREDYVSRNLVQYTKTFGYIADARTAVDVATIIAYEVYGDCHLKEAPFNVAYDQQANVWVVSGTLPPDTVGGVIVVAIDKDTGEVIMITHGK